MNSSHRIRNIGLLGGSFDPVHIAHIALATEALERFQLDEVRLMPCAQQALKDHAPAPAQDRCAMLRLALAHEPRCTLDCCELFHGGKTYTYNTLTRLKAREPHAQFWFIVGMDSVLNFHRWYRAKELLDLCNFIVFDRPGVEVPERPFDSRLLTYRLQGPRIDVSSSELRQRVAKSQQIRYPMGELTERYLRDHNLYH